MENNLIITGFIATNTGLLTGKSKSGNDYVYNDFQLRTDEELPMRPWFHLTGEMAQMFSAIQLTPEMQVRVYFRLYARDYADRNGVTRHSTELGVSLIEILDIDGEVAHVCQKSQL